MSSQLYATRLFWNGSAGVAKLYWRQVVLDMKPDIPWLEFESLDYIPEIDLRLIRLVGGQERDMTLAEVRLADNFLRLKFKENP